MKRFSFEKSQKEDRLSNLKKNGDFVSYENLGHHTPYRISYLYSIVDTNILHRDLLQNLEDPFDSLEELKKKLPFEEIIITNDVDELEERILKGYVALSLVGKDDGYILLSCIDLQGRDIIPPMTEYSVEGPKEAFVESMKTNINLVRKRLPVVDLKIELMEVGAKSRTGVALLYMENEVNMEDVNLVRTKIEAITIDNIADSAYIQQIIQDNWRSPFPQLKNTERPERLCNSLCEGKVCILVDGSSFALSGPSSIFDFFNSSGDYYLTWQVASVFRIMRYFALLFSLLATPLYVATLTFHYELIPRDLLGTLVGSRVDIPFPPILEALFLEITIELLREAGARMPSKIAQTIGIVGGIVLGTASVEAGLTSNVLIIIVALTTISSYTSPVYRMGNAFRVVRFVFLIFASYLGLIGIAICGAFLLTHLLRLTSLGHPYMTPIYPPRSEMWRDMLIRLPFRYLRRQNVSSLSMEQSFKDIFKKKQKTDIDE